MTSKQSGTLLSVPRRSNSMRPPSTIPLSSTSSSRLNRSSEIHPLSSREPSPVFGSSAVSRAKRTNENQPPGTTHKTKDGMNAGSRPSSRADTARQHRNNADTSSDGSSNRETNIHVVVRCRGRNDREVKENSGVVVSTTSAKEITVQTGPLALSNKTYTFDRVFGPEADQVMVYEDVVSPILEEALSGYNCTVFAYGQTGTGKTYTMSGDVSDNFGTFSSDAGIIPRALYRLFLALESEQSEYSVKCSFIELYNEELRDLISKEDDKKVKIFEDTNKKGIVIQGMEESFIKTAEEGLKILQDGSHKRQVAATKCNDLSSRSHTVFTITVHVKETSSAGEEYLRIGKLNLVDLAGSENISRSGAENKRAREAGMINQSLLTLGRVINALVDRSSHIPYRESKLTRLLQDSLGGRTKTCIIATISPAKMNLEETISTLDYASRAKSIRNKPQLNQVMSKKALIKEYILEIERLKSDLQACRQKNGVYITSESYQELTAESESRRILVDEQKRKIEVMEEQLKTTRDQYEQSMRTMIDTKRELEFTNKLLSDAKGSLAITENDLRVAKAALDQEVSLSNAYAITEDKLTKIGKELILSVKDSNAEIENLHGKIEKESLLAVTNKEVFEKSQQTVAAASSHFEGRLKSYTEAQIQNYDSASLLLKNMLTEETGKLGNIYKMIEKQVSDFEEKESSLKQLTSGSKDELNQVLENIKVLRDDIKGKVGEGLEGLTKATEKIAEELMNQIEVFQNQTSTSYNQLGRDIKGMFDEFQKRMHSQNADIESLHAALVAASSNVSSEIDERSLSLQKALEEEEQVAAEERKELLAEMKNQIERMSSHIERMSEEQTKRLRSRVGSIREGMTSSKEQLDTAGSTFIEGVSGWLNNQADFQRGMLQTKEKIKQTIIESYRLAEQQGEHLQESTKSIHSESIKIVNSQKENLNSQMKSLDEFVMHARAQNEKHYEAYSVASREIDQMVKNGFNSANGSINDVGRDLHLYSNEAIKLYESAKHDTNVHKDQGSKDFTALRERVLNIKMSQSMSTGNTPRKTRVLNIPNELPRTRPRNSVIPLPESVQIRENSELNDLKN
ncbi:P-loop containing nucleoside triphosphate hydrolase protein [Dipodascopsis uninucleata]